MKTTVPFAVAALVAAAVLAGGCAGSKPEPAASPGAATAGTATPATARSVAAPGQLTGGTTRNPGDVAQAPATPIADASLGLAKGSVFDVPSPPPVKANASAPGELPLLPRAWVGAPPQVPHAVEDFLPITRTQNPCLDCHGVKDAQKGDPTPLPPSHYTDYRRAPGQPGAEVVGARYVCTACHASITNAGALVENRFKP